MEKDFTVKVCGRDVAEKQTIVEAMVRASQEMAQLKNVYDEVLIHDAYGEVVFMAFIPETGPSWHVARTSIS